MGNLVLYLYINSVITFSTPTIKEGGGGRGGGEFVTALFGSTSTAVLKALCKSEVLQIRISQSKLVLGHLETKMTWGVGGTF